MVDKSELELKELRDIIYELEDEMSVSTRNNLYNDDIRKSKKLLLYRYALLLQIKDIRKVRRKIETRIDRINSLKSLGARGRILTPRESQAIKEIEVDVRKREDIVEIYDNKKEVYSDKRLAYYGFDDELEEVFFKHQTEFDPFFEVNEKNVADLKRQLDEGHKFKNDLSADEILALNEERYGDEIVDFELGIIFDAEDKTEITIKENENETNNNADNENQEDVPEEYVYLDNILKLEEDIENKETTEEKEELYNYYNGYNLYKEPMKKIILDSIDDEIANDIASESKNISETSKSLLEEDFDKFKNSKEDFLDEENKTIEDNVANKKIVVTDDAIFSKSSQVKTKKLVKDKIILKEKLENYINRKGNDMTREFYNNEIRNNDLDDQMTLDELDKKLNLDLYILGILYQIDKKISKLKNSDDPDTEAIKVLINNLYQVNMEYKLYPGYCFESVSEYLPETIVEDIRNFDDENTKLDVQELYRAAISFTISAEDVKKKYREMYGLDKNTVTSLEDGKDIDNEAEDEGTNDIE